MENMAYLLMKTSRLLKGTLDQRLQEHDVTARQFSVLNQIANHNGRITSAEVAKELESDRPTISGVINRLEKSGYLQRKENPKDRRSAYLKLNKEALKLVEELRVISDEVNQQVFDTFTDCEKSNMNDYLVKLLHRIEKLY